MVNEKMKRNITELSVILNYVDKSIVDKIPKSFKDFVNKEKSDDYNFIYDPTKSLEDQNINDDTLLLLSIIFTKWCVSDEVRKEITDQWMENDKEYEKKLSEQFDYNNIFQNNKTQIESNEIDLNKKNNTALIEIKEESIIKKIIRRLKEMFNKNGD